MSDDPAQTPGEPARQAPARVPTVDSDYDRARFDRDETVIRFDAENRHG